MTIGSNIAASGPFFPNGVTTQFPFEIEIDFATDISVVWVSADGSETLVPSASYTVQISNTAPGGTVTFTSPPVLPNAGDQLWIVLDPEFEQQYRFSDEGPFNQSLLEGAVDSNARLSIWLRSRLLRTVFAPFGEALKALPGKAARAGRFLAFDVNGDPIAASGAGADGALRSDIAASGGSALIGFQQSGPGAVVRDAQARGREQLKATDYSTAQQAFNRARAVGGDVEFPAGTYAISTPLTIDYTGQTQEPVTQPLGVNITGDGAHNTVISKSGSGFAIESTGGTGVAAHIYTVFDGLSFTGANAKGIKLKNHAFTTLRNMTFQGLVTGLELESVLSCRFENLTFGNATNGVEVSKGTGFSDINANYWDNCTFRNLTGVAYAGGDHSGVYFTAANVENCGTQANALTGGFNMTFDGAEGSVGLTIYGGYFEGNGGGWDINLVNTGSEYVTHVLIGVNFNRNSAAKFVTNNIRSVGKNRILLIGCTFDHFNDYTPDAGRLYVNADADTQVTCIGCKFKSATEQGSLRNSDVALGGSFDGAGASVRLPSGWSVSRSSAGVYVVTHNLNLATANYVVTAVSEETVARQVQRIVKGLNSFTVVTQDATGAAADSAVGFLLSVIP